MFILFGVITVLISFSQNQQEISIIPVPVSLQTGKGSFQIKSTTSVEISSVATDVKRVAHFLSDKLKQATGYTLPVKQQAIASKTSGNIRLAITKDALLGEEGYKLNVTPSTISITANSATGLFYAIQTLYQLVAKTGRE